MATSRYGTGRTIPTQAVSARYPSVSVTWRGFDASGRNAAAPRLQALTIRRTAASTCCPEFRRRSIRRRLPASREVSSEPLACFRFRRAGRCPAVRTTWRPCSTSGRRRTPDRHRGPEGLAEARAHKNSATSNGRGPLLCSRRWSTGAGSGWSYSEPVAVPGMASLLRSVTDASPCASARASA